MTVRWRSVVVRPVVFVVVCLVTLAAGCSATPVSTSAADPLPSWRDGAARTAIVRFVEAVTDPTDPAFVPEGRRIATFDNDGTLWVEHPVYTQLQFALDRVRQLAPGHPEWNDRQPFKAIIENDARVLKTLTAHQITEIIMLTHAGMTPEAFEALVREWLETARHPRFDVPYTELAYLPMVELLNYLRDNGFKTFIVTGGGIEFVRAFAEKTYGVPRWQVVGSSVKTRFDLVGGKGEIRRMPEIGAIVDGPGKPVGIGLHIGLRPIAAFGNSDGDIQMLEYTDSGDGPQLEMLVHHDDAEREYAYSCDTKIGRLCKGLTLAGERGWVLISMKDDWKRLFAVDLKPVGR